jgi:hypothetical protein
MEMNQDKTPCRSPDPARLEALRLLPKEITETLTKEEISTFLFEEEWPETLAEKLKDYLV